MSLPARLAAALLMAFSLLAPVAAQNQPAPKTDAGLVAFASEEGLVRLARSSAKVDFPALANQFEAQSNAAFCGPTTTAIVLNTLRSRSSELPRDGSRLKEADLQYMPKGFDLTVPRYTQDNVLLKGRKTRAQVLGEPFEINGKLVRDPGYQVRQLDQMLQAHGLLTQLVIVDDAKAESDIRAELIDNLQRAGDYVIVAYRRNAVGQSGGGHISPLGAYDAQSDSFLVLDVNPSSFGWVWMPTGTLVNGMRTLDMVENRGYILVKSQ